MKHLLRDPNGAAGGATDVKIDVEALKSDINNSTRTMLNEAVDTMKTIVTNHVATTKESQSSGKDSKASRERSTDAALEEYRSELDSLGIEEPEQQEAFLRVMEKAIQKHVPQFKKEVIETVETKNNWDTSKLEHDRDAMRRYPDVSDKNGTLFKTASQIYAGMNKNLQAEPDAMALAVERAAKKLGVQESPSVEDSYGNAAGNNTRGQGNSSGKSKITSADLEFAKTFGVNPDHFTKRYNEVLSRQ